MEGADEEGRPAEPGPGAGEAAADRPGVSEDGAPAGVRGVPLSLQQVHPRDRALRPLGQDRETASRCGECRSKGSDPLVVCEV